MSKELKEKRDELRGFRYGNEGTGEISAVIIEHICTLRETSSGWTKELNYVAWLDHPTKFDIREWNKDHTKATRGITLSEGEMRTLAKEFSAWDEEKYLDKFMDSIERGQDNE